MKELDWIILTSWPPPPRTPQLQQAGPHCSLRACVCVCVCACVCACVCGEPIPHAHWGCISHMNVNHLFNWLPWPGDLGRTASLFSSFTAAFWLCLCAVILASIHSQTVETGAGLEASGPLTPSHPPLSSLSIFTSSPSLYSFIQHFVHHMPC